LHRRHIFTALFAAFLASVAGCGTTETAEEPPEHSQPNIVLILADDMGVASVGAYHPESGVPTPNIDRLADEGMRFLDAHSGSAVCSPTRYGLLTGRYAWRTSLKSGVLNPWEGPLISEERLTIADLLREQGYRTACFGKWHLGWRWPDIRGRPTTNGWAVDYTKPIRGGPLAHGFDHYFGDDVPNCPPYVWIEDERARAIPTDFMRADPSNGVSAGPMTPGWRLDAVLPTLTERCVDYIAQAAHAGQPFFLYFPMTSPHAPISPSEAFRGTSGVSRYVDFLIETDWAVGEVLRALEDNGIAGNTLVIFTADNGTSPECDFEWLAARGIDLRARWRGYKADIWEGGHRVPFLVRWPGVIHPRSTSAGRVSLVDVMATVAEIVGYDLPESAAEDSVSLLPALLDEEENAPLREAVITHSSLGCFAIHSGPWKLAFCPGSCGWSEPVNPDTAGFGLPGYQLYDMTADPGEQHNLCDEYPEIVSELTDLFWEIVTSGRSTPGAQVSNDGPAVWAQLPWS
jgi:arylsulfatase A-like enzyme